ncbi:hypothetical protein MMC18_009568, partial [Xylographa bjoerkii]|nr:hypothetical protein [Xylographa bjoerkii]
MVRKATNKDLRADKIRTVANIHRSASLNRSRMVGRASSSPKEEKQAYNYNLDQQTVSTQAFNQSMGNAPQYVNQEETQQVQSYNSQFGAQPSPAPFSPGINQPGTP